MNHSSMYAGIPQHGPWVKAVGREDLPALLASRSRVILLLGTTSPRSFLLPIVHHFVARLGDDVRFAYFRLEALSDRAWVLQFVSPVFHDESRRLRGARGGYYLFVNGQAVGFHRGLADPRLGPLTHAASGAQPSGEVLRSFQRLVQDVSRSVVACFEPLLFPQRRSQRQVLCPYAVLGLSPAATDAEIKTAFRKKMRQTHPDLVTTRSEEQKQRAHELTQVLVAAYRQISAERSGR